MISELSTCPRPRTTRTGRWPVSTAAQPEGGHRCPPSSRRRAGRPLRSKDGPDPPPFSFQTLSLPGTRSPCLSSGGSAHLALRARAKGRRCRCSEGRQGRHVSPWGAGSPDTGSKGGAKALAPGTHCLAHRTTLPAGASAPASSSGIGLLLGQLTAEGPSLSGAHGASSRILTSRLTGRSPRPSRMFREACLGW